MNAAVFIDVQNDFVTGSLGSDWAEETVPDIKKFARACRAKGYALYATADSHFKDSYAEMLEGQKLPVEHCIIGTEGHEIVDGLVKDENGDVIIPECNIFDKPTFGSHDLMAKMADDFVDPLFCKEDEVGDLGEPLDTIYVCGFCTSICVSANVQLIKALFPNAKIVVLRNLCADIDDESHKAAIKVMTNCHIDVKTCNFNDDGSFRIED